MKVAKEELKNMSVNDLFAKSEELRRELLRLRLKASTSHVKSYPSEKRNLKKTLCN
jgi:ribosomal protein L29